MTHLNNPNQGKIEGEWYLNIMHIPDFGTIQFMCESAFFFTGTPCLMGHTKSIAQECPICLKKIDEGITIFVVYKLRKSIEWQACSRIAIQLDAEDVFCSKEKFPAFLEWQMNEHKKICNANTKTTPTG